MASGWECIKIGSAAVAKITPVAPWVLAAYLAAHPLPADCARAECHFVIPREEFLPGGMFEGREAVVPKPKEAVAEAGGGEVVAPGEAWGDGPFSTDAAAPRLFGGLSEGGGETGGGASGTGGGGGPLVGPRGGGAGGGNGGGTGGGPVPVLSGGGGGPVTFGASVPEPPSFVLVAAALAGFGMLRRR